MERKDHLGLYKLASAHKEVVTCKLEVRSTIRMTNLRVYILSV